MSKEPIYISVTEKLPYGYGAVYVSNVLNEETYGMYVMGKHFLDEGKWIIMGKYSNFIPVKWREIPEEDRQLPKFKEAFKMK